jgi:hypothetical protein
MMDTVDATLMQHHSLTDFLIDADVDADVLM